MATPNALEDHTLRSTLDLYEAEYQMARRSLLEHWKRLLSEPPAPLEQSLRSRIALRLLSWHVGKLLDR